MPQFLCWSAAQISQICCLEEMWKGATALPALQVDGKQLHCAAAGLQVLKQLDMTAFCNCIKCSPDYGFWMSPGMSRLALLHCTAVHSLTPHGPVRGHTFG